MAGEADKAELVTPQMIRAGVAVYVEWETAPDQTNEDEHSIEALVGRVFLAMEARGRRR